MDKKQVKVEKVNHILPGLQIRITLGSPSRENTEFTSWDHTNTNNIIPQTIHTIVSPPSKRSRKNGVYGVWVQGVNGKVFLWFHEWQPYIPPKPMVRKKFPELIRTKKPQLVRRR